MRRLTTTAGRWRFSQSHPDSFRDVRWSRPCLVPTRRHARSCSCSVPRSAQAAPDPTQEHKDELPVPPADHRAIGEAQQLFMHSRYSPGSPIFLPNGTHIINKLTSFLRGQYHVYGFQEVISPTMYKQSLWETSGHWENYKDDMYEVTGRGASGQRADAELGEDESYGLKPMNCPGHCLIFKDQLRSYRDLPIRYADFGALHRNEISGALTGLTRVRRFHQDDGHIFCRPHQILDEIQRTLIFVQSTMSAFRLDSYRYVLSTRPEKDYIGTIAEWDRAEAQLVTALDKSSIPWSTSPGDGAFYGPKIDIILRDSSGKEHQTATIQLDFQLPKRFNLSYQVPDSEPDHTPENNGRATPVLVHRAVLGSLERFLALLTEHHAGRWPFWLSPFQAVVLPVKTDDPATLAAADLVTRRLQGYSPFSPTDPPKRHPRHEGTETFAVALDARPETLAARIRDAKKTGYGLVVVVGERNLDEKDRRKVRDVDVDISRYTAGERALDMGRVLQEAARVHRVPMLAGAGRVSCRVDVLRGIMERMARARL